MTRVARPSARPIAIPLTMQLIRLPTTPPPIYYRVRRWLDGVQASPTLGALPRLHLVLPGVRASSGAHKPRPYKRPTQRPKYFSKP